MPRERTIRRHRPRSRKLSGPPLARKGHGPTQLLETAQLTVGNFLRSTRESLKLTQAQVAERTHQSPWQLSRAAVSAIERGQNFPGLEAMLALSNVLNIDPKELIENFREFLQKGAVWFFHDGDVKIREACLPQNPREFDITARTGATRDLSGIMSSAHSGSG